MTLYSFIILRISQLREQGRFRTAETYNSARTSFKTFMKGEDIELERIDRSHIEAYEQWLKERNVTPNTSSFYMRILRAVYNRAVKEELIEDKRPFRMVYTGIAMTEKRAIRLEDLIRLRDKDFSSYPILDYSRDIFMLSFYLRGMSFIDMAYLEKNDLRDGYLYYRRMKTGTPLTIEWTEEMRRILLKYPENRSKYLLPILIDEDGKERRRYRTVLGRVNRSLKIVAREVGIHGRLTLYVARHSWATIAQYAGIPLGIISEGMGHNSESTTRIYLANLRQSAVDEANGKILELLSRKTSFRTSTRKKCREVLHKGL